MKGILYLAFAGIFSGLIPIWIRLIGQSVSPFTLAFIRTMFAAGIIFVFVVFFENMKALRINKKDIIMFILAGFFGITLGVGLYVKAVTLIPVANAVVLLYIYPVVTAFLSWAILKENISKWDALGLFLALSGIWVIYSHDFFVNTNVFGNFLAITTGICYSAVIVTMRYFEAKERLAFWSVTFWLLFFGGLGMLMFLPFENIVILPSHDMFLFVAGIILTTFLMYMFYSKGLKAIKAHRAPMLVMLTEPITAIVLAFLIFSETIQPSVLLGGVMIMLANVVTGKAK